MKLRFCTSVAGERFSFAEGQTIDVPALPHEFRVWLADGTVEVVKDDALEVAALDPLGQTATLAHTRPLKGRGRGRRLSVSRPVPA